MKTNTTVEFVVPPRQWERFRDELLAARAGREEVIGFFFCTRHRVEPDAERLLPRVWVVPEPDCYDHQSVGGLSLNQSFHAYLVENYVKHGLIPVHCHTHPTLAPPEFSGVDDRHEAEYARFLAGVPGRPYLVSGVFNERLERGRFRLWSAGGEESPRAVSFSHGWAPGDAEPDAALATDPRFDRQRVFGLGVQEALDGLKVGLVGCGGLGAVFAEQLARLGVRQWVLIDPDQLDETNLNRMPCATPTMAMRDWPKVRYVKQLVNRAWPVGATVRKLQAPVEDRRAENLLAACDLIVVCTDNHHSRMICQELALRYVRPLLCLGVDIALSDSGGLRRLLARITMPPMDGGWCLICGDVIDVPQGRLGGGAAGLGGRHGGGGVRARGDGPGGLLAHQHLRFAGRVRRSRCPRGFR